jgi:hypothetical protein
MKKVVPEKQMDNIAHSTKGLFTFKTDARNQFYPYELLNYNTQPTLIVPLRRTAKGTEKLIDQHGFNTKNLHFIDIISKHIGSSLEHKKTKYLQEVKLNDIQEAIDAKMVELGPGPKTIVLEDFHILIPHHGDLNSRRFLDHLSKRMEYHFTKTIVLADNRKLPKEVSKFLFTRSEDVIEIPK